MLSVLCKIIILLMFENLSAMKSVENTFANEQTMLGMSAKQNLGQMCGVQFLRTPDILPNKPKRSSLKFISVNAYRSWSKFTLTTKTCFGRPQAVIIRKKRWIFELIRHNIPFVLEKENPTNVPQARLIESKESLKKSTYLLSRTWFWWLETYYGIFTRLKGPLSILWTYFSTLYE